MLNTVKSRYLSGKKIKWITILFTMCLLMIGNLAAQSKGVNKSDLYDNSTYLSQSTPGTMIPGQSYGVSVTMKNTGRSTWHQGNYSLKLTNIIESAEKTWSVNSVDVNSTVSPGNEVVFNFTIIAPVNGSYNMQWQMANGNAFFGEPSNSVPIRVSSGTDIYAEKPNCIENNALFISQKGYSEMETGLTYDMRVTMKNTGNTTWKPGEYKLKVSTAGADNKRGAWSVANVELSNDVTAGSEVVFSFKVTAPKKDGIYNFQGQMVKDVTFFGQPTTNIVIKVD